VIIQHEIDHLQGVVFTQRVLEQKNPLYKEKNGQLKPVDFV
jgi:peptide deformylase